MAEARPFARRSCGYDRTEGAALLLVDREFTFWPAPEPLAAVPSPAPVIFLKSGGKPLRSGFESRMAGIEPQHGSKEEPGPIRAILARTPV